MSHNPSLVGEIPNVLVKSLVVSLQIPSSCASPIEISAHGALDRSPPGEAAPSRPGSHGAPGSPGDEGVCANDVPQYSLHCCNFPCGFVQKMRCPDLGSCCNVGLDAGGRVSTGSCNC